MTPEQRVEWLRERVGTLLSPRAERRTHVSREVYTGPARRSTTVPVYVAPMHESQLPRLLVLETDYPDPE